MDNYRLEGTVKQEFGEGSQGIETLHEQSGQQANICMFKVISVKVWNNFVIS